MKVVADSFDNAGELFRALLGFEDQAMEMWKQVQPFSKAGNGRALPRFVTETSVQLHKLLVSDFSMMYPSIASVIENGLGGTDASFGRLHDAVYQFNAAQQTLHAKNCVVMADADRQKLTEQLSQVVGDLVIFTIVQFGLFRLEQGEVTLAVQEHCEAAGMSPDVLYGILQQEMEEVGQTYYAYEALSPYCVALNELDPNFVAECEEILFPLTDAMAEQILDGTVDLPYVRGLLLDAQKGHKEVEVNVNPETLISQMQLR